MSDDDRDIDVESDDDIDSDTPPPPRHISTQNYTQAEKRAHHNALERKRRDHIKASFTNLREAVPSLKGEKASRAQILKKTTECIQTMRRKIESSKKDIEEIKKQNALLDAQIHVLENAAKGYEVDSGDFQQLTNSSEVSSQLDSDEDEDFNQRKKMKTSFGD